VANPIRSRFTDTGLSWADVKQYMKEIGKAHNGSVWVVCGLRPTVSQGEVLYWSVKFKFGPISHDYCENFAERHDWPAGDWKTVTNMVYALLVKLDWKITEAERRKAEQASF
jgi:hypothetical protein